MSHRNGKKGMDRCAGSIKRLLIAAAAALIMTGCATNTQAVSESGAAQESANPQVSSAAEDKAALSSESAEPAGPADASAQAPGEADEAFAESESETVEMVTVVIPTVYENVTSQEEADAIRDKNGYASAVLEDDGSLRIEMSRSQYDEMLRQFKESVDEGIREIVSQGAGSTIEKIEYNDDYSVFTVTVAGDEIGIIERQTAEELIMYGTLYHIYTGNDAEHIEVDYVSSGSGEVIESAESGSLDSAY